MPEGRKIVDIREAAEFLHVSPGTMYRMSKRGELPGALKIGRVWRFDLDELERFTQTNMSRPK